MFKIKKKCFVRTIRRRLGTPPAPFPDRETYGFVETGELSEVVARDGQSIRRRDLRVQQSHELLDELELLHFKPVRILVPELFRVYGALGELTGGQLHLVSLK